MTHLIPSMRLKVKGDTFYIPDSAGGVYLKNNTVSFRIEGKSIDRWVEKLLPMLNGEYTLEELTKGLSDQHRERVYEIAKILFKHGFVRDVSQDQPHQLPEHVLKKYASQIQFLDNLAGSGASRFQTYRQAKVLVIGYGSFLTALVSALLESGLARFHLLITDAEKTHHQRLEQLIQFARQTDPEVHIEVISWSQFERDQWKELLQPFQAVFYGSDKVNMGEVRELHAVCRTEKKVFIPALCWPRVGLAGPLVEPDSEHCFESAWRRIHHTRLDMNASSSHTSTTAVALLANVATFEFFKAVTGLNELELKNKLFLLNVDTLEGNWHTFLPHPAVVGYSPVQKSLGFISKMEQEEQSQDIKRLFSYFTLLTSKETGIFHIWEEGELKQLPLAQCRVQVADPLSDGPARLLPERVCSGLTHDEARREAGLSGIEQYVSRWLQQQALPADILKPWEYLGIGAGETLVEGISRGLQKGLENEWSQFADRKKPYNRVYLNRIEDERCQYYLQALMTLQGEPIIGLSEDQFGFPVVWVGLKGNWVYCVDIHVTLALRKALKQALQQVQTLKAEEEVLTIQTMGAASFLNDTNRLELDIPAYPEMVDKHDLQTALKRLEQHRIQLICLDLAIEPFLKQEIAGVFGVVLREEEAG